MNIDFEMDDDNEYSVKSNLEIKNRPSSRTYYKEKDYSACNDDPKYKLYNLTVPQIRRAFKKQLHYKWTFYNEREFLENLLTKRFNFLLVAYSFFLISLVTIYTSHTCLCHVEKKSTSTNMCSSKQRFDHNDYVIYWIYCSWNDKY